MGYNDLFGQMQWMGPYHLSEVTMPVTVNTMDTKRRYLQFKIEGKRSYFLIDRKNGEFRAVARSRGGGSCAHVAMRNRYDSRQRRDEAHLPAQV